MAGGQHSGPVVSGKIGAWEKPRNTPQMGRIIVWNPTPRCCGIFVQIINLIFQKGWSGLQAGGLELCGAF